MTRPRQRATGMPDAVGDAAVLAETSRIITGSVAVQVVVVPLVLALVVARGVGLHRAERCGPEHGPAV